MSFKYFLFVEVLDPLQTSQFFYGALPIFSTTDWWIAVKHVGYMFQNMLCCQIKIGPHENTVMHVFVRFTTTKRIAASVGVDTQIFDPFAMVWYLT